MVYSLYLRDKAEQALRLARDSTDQVLVRGLIEDAAEYLGRAEAIDLVESLKEVAADFGVDGRPRTRDAEHPCLLPAPIATGVG